MNSTLKQIIKNHIDIIQYKYSECYIKVKIIDDEIFIYINSLEISNNEDYEKLIYKFIKEYDNNGFYNVFWSINSLITKNDLIVLEDFVQIPQKENFKVNELNFFMQESNNNNYKYNISENIQNKFPVQNNIHTNSLLLSEFNFQDKYGSAA